MGAKAKELAESNRRDNKPGRASCGVCRTPRDDEVPADKVWAWSLANPGVAVSR